MRCAFLPVLAIATACGGYDAAGPEAPPTASVVVTAARSLLVTGDSLVLTAQALDASGRPVAGRAVTWASSNPQAVTIGNDGAARAVAEGDATITATIDGRSGSILLAVRNVLLEDSRRVSGPVGAGGDTLSVTSAAGITYRLEIPAGALERTTTIALTPVTGLAGARFSGGLLGGLRLEPAGLRFLQPVRLRISGLTAPTGGRVPVAFVARDGGELEGLVPGAFANGTLTVLVPHFSIVGGGAELPAALAGIAPCPAPCTGAASFQHQLTVQLAQNASRASITQTLASWGASIESSALIPGLIGSAQLLTAISEYGLWIATIEFVANLRPDLASFFAEEPLNAQMLRNLDHMIRALEEGISRNLAACGTTRSLAEAEVVLFWQDQVRALQLIFDDLVPAGHPRLANMTRPVVLEQIRIGCFEIVMDTLTLPDPLEIGATHQVLAAFKVEFDGVVRQGAPFQVVLATQELTITPGQGFTDLNGEFPATMRVEAAARALGFAFLDVTACLVLPTEAARGPLAKASDICLAQEIPRSVVLYSSGFETGAGSEWTVTQTSSTPNGQRFLGELGNQSVLLTVDSLPGHARLTLEVDLYIIDSWNGNGGVGSSAAPDVISVSVFGGDIIKRTTFSNKPRDAQAFPQDFPGGHNPAGTGAFALNTLGYPPGSDHFGDALYRLRLTFPHTAASLVLHFASGQTAAAGASSERWGIDNVRIYQAR